MAEEYLRREKFDLARGEYEAIGVFSPEDPWPYRMIADTYATQGNWAMRAAALREALRRPGPQGMLSYQLGLCEMELKHTSRALRAMGIAAQAPEFTPEERTNARFYFAGLLTDLGQPNNAIAVLNAILAEDSTYAPAKKLLSLLERSKK
jgi:tetratricopeptide (TPR) repeat protein